MASRPLAFATASPRAHEPGRLTGRRVLLIALAALGVVLAMNGTFVWLALDGFSGLSRPNAYREGLHYNEELAAAEAQRARGWTSRYELAADRLTLEVRLADGTPVTGLRLSATLGRPATDRYDWTLTLTETEPGRYVAGVALPAGQWSITTRGQDDAGQSYRSQARLWHSPT